MVPEISQLVDGTALGLCWHHDMAEGMVQELHTGMAVRKQREGRRRG